MSEPPTLVKEAVETPQVINEPPPMEKLPGDALLDEEGSSEEESPVEASVKAQDQKPCDFAQSLLVPIKIAIKTLQEVYEITLAHGSDSTNVYQLYSLCEMVSQIAYPAQIIVLYKEMRKYLESYDL